MVRVMRALVKAAPEPGLRMEEAPIPEPGLNGVLIKVRRSAICGTDVHIHEWDGWAQKHIKPPIVIGHEFAGAHQRRHRLRHTEIREGRQGAGDRLSDPHPALFFALQESPGVMTTGQER